MDRNFREELDAIACGVTGTYRAWQRLSVTLQNKASRKVTLRSSVRIPGPSPAEARPPPIWCLYQKR